MMDRDIEELYREMLQCFEGALPVGLVKLHDYADGLRRQLGFPRFSAENHILFAVLASQLGPPPTAPDTPEVAEWRDVPRNSQVHVDFHGDRDALFTGIDQDHLIVRLRGEQKRRRLVPHKVRLGEWRKRTAPPITKQKKKGRGHG